MAYIKYMNLIDDKGRLFGTVNVIDALVVLLVVSVAVVGTAFVLQSDSGDAGSTAPAEQSDTSPATRFVTVNLGSHPNYVAERITEGDTGTVTSGNLTITDVYRVPTNKGIRVWARVQLNGRAVERQNDTEFAFGGRHLEPGTKLTVATDEYRLKGRIYGMDTSGPDLPGKTMQILVSTTTGVGGTNDVQVNDTYRVANNTVATIESVEIYPAAKADRRRIVFGVSVRTLALNGRQLFLGDPVQLGRKFFISTDDYDLTGQIIKMNSLTLSKGSEEVVLQTTTSAEKAATINVNDTYEVSGNTLATIRSVTVHPTNTANRKRVVLGMTLQTVTNGGRETFVNRPVRIGGEIPFRTDSYQIDGTIIHLGNTTLPGERATTTARIKLSGVAAEVADGIQTGMVERINDNVSARITAKRVEPATVVLTSQDGDIYAREHPTKKDIYLTVELGTRRTDTGLYFHGVQLQEGDNLTLNLGSVTVRGQVIRLERDT